MIYLNENDNLHYTDAEFTTLANGFDYDDWSGYYIEGVLTTLNGEGFGTWNDVFYAYGSPDSNYTGPDYWDWVYYIESQLTTLDIDGNGEWNGDNYANGVIVIPAKNGWIDGVYYINDLVTTLDSSGNGTWNGITFINGINLNYGLQAFYKLSDLTDASGNGRTLTNNGNVSFASGKIGNAAVFDGTNYLDTNVSVNDNSAFTISCWSDCDSIHGGDNAIFGSMTTGNERAVLFGYSDGNSYASLNTVNNGYVQISGPSIVSQEWMHLTLSYNGSKAKMYVDGVLYAEANCSGIVNAEPSIRIGADGNGGSTFIGKVDAAGIWNRALSDSEITALYNSGAGLEEFGGAPQTQSFVKLLDTVKFSGKVKFMP